MTLQITENFYGHFTEGSGSFCIPPLSFPRKRWFDRPFDRLTVLSVVEGLTTLSKVEGESRIRLLDRNWMPASAGMTGKIPRLLN